MSGMICHMDWPLLMVFPSFRRCCRVPLQGLSGCIWRMRSQSRARRLTPSCVLTQRSRAWDLEVPVPSPGLLSPYQQNLQYHSGHEKQRCFHVIPGISAITTKTAQHFRLENLNNPSTVEGWSTIRQIWYQRFIGTIGGSNVHMPWTMDVDTYCTNLHLHIFAYSQGSNTTQYEFYSNQTWCPQLALSHCPGRDHKAKVAPQWQISHTILDSDMEMKTVMQGWTSDSIISNLI